MADNAEKKPKRSRKPLNPTKRDVSTVDCSVFLESNYWKRKNICCGQILCANRMVMYNDELIKPCEKHKLLAKAKATKENSTPQTSKSADVLAEETPVAKPKESVATNAEQKPNSPPEPTPAATIVIKKEPVEPTPKKHNTADPKPKGNYEKVIILKRKLPEASKASNTKTPRSAN